MSSPTPIPNPVLDWLLNQAWALILTIIGVVIGELAVYHLLREREKPKIIIKPISRKIDAEKNCRMKDFGFEISVERRMIRDARVRIDNVNYPWNGEDNQPLDRKDLYVGDAPSTVYPFQSIIEYVENVTENPQFKSIKADIFPPSKHGILNRLVDKKTGQNMLLDGYVIPENSSRIEVKLKPTEKSIEFPLRLIGEGIEEKRDYVMCLTSISLKVPLTDSIPNMDEVSARFELEPKKKNRFW